MSYDPKKLSDEFKDLKVPEAGDDFPQEVEIPQEAAVQNEKNAAEALKLALDSAGINTLLDTLIEGLETLKNEMYKYYSNRRLERLSLTAQMELIAALKICIADVINVYFELRESENSGGAFTESTSDAPAGNNDKEN